MKHQRLTLVGLFVALIVVFAGLGPNAASARSLAATATATTKPTAKPTAKATAKPTVRPTQRATTKPTARPKATVTPVPASPTPVTFTNPPETLRLAYFPNVTHATALVGVARGTFQQAIGSVRLETKTFNAGPALIEALFAGQIDIGYLGPNPAINGYVRSKGAALRVIAGGASGGALFIVRPGANIASAADLAGKKLATPQLGGTQDVALRFYLQENGLQTTDKGGSVQIIPTANPDILTLFKQGQIDGAWVPEPWASRLLLEGNGKVFVDERDTWAGGAFVTTTVIVSKKFLAEHPDVVTAFVRAHVDTTDFIKTNLSAAKPIINSEIERITTAPLSAAVLDRSFTTTDITYDPLPTTFLKTADSAFALGFLGDEKPDLRGLFDFGPLNTVLKAKGRPAIAAP